MGGGWRPAGWLKVLLWLAAIFVVVCLALWFMSACTKDSGGTSGSAPAPARCV
jgi:hypothetical protein